MWSAALQAHTKTSFVGVSLLSRWPRHDTAAPKQLHSSLQWRWQHGQLTFPCVTFAGLPAHPQPPPTLHPPTLPHSQPQSHAASRSMTAHHPDLINITISVEALGTLATPMGHVSYLEQGHFK